MNKKIKYTSRKQDTVKPDYMCIWLSYKDKILELSLYNLSETDDEIALWIDDEELTDNKYLVLRNYNFEEVIVYYDKENELKMSKYIVSLDNINKDEVVYIQHADGVEYVNAYEIYAGLEAILDMSSTNVTKTMNVEENGSKSHTYTFKDNREDKISEMIITIKLKAFGFDNNELDISYK